MLIRKNTKAFKTIEQIITACRDRADREALVRLYITKAGNSVDERIPIEGIEGNAALFYDMTYQAIVSNLKSAGHQLQQSDDVEGIYFFHSSSNKVWAETPFEFDETVKKEFGDLPDLPLVRKKGKAEKFTFPSPRKTSGTGSPKNETRQKPAKQENKPVVKPGPPQPRFKLKQPIHFTDLEKIVFRQPQLTRRNILTYYNQVADHLLPWLKDRPLTLMFRRPDGRRIKCATKDDLAENNIETPDWLKTGKIPRAKGECLLCNDREHLLFWVETGSVEFAISPFRIKTMGSPDYLVIGVESPHADVAKAVEVAGAAKIILDALQIPAFIKTNGTLGIHIYVPLGSTDEPEKAGQVAEYVCKLIRLKMPSHVALEGSGDHEYGKVRLEYSVNDPNQTIPAPYSVMEGESPLVATPLAWDDLVSHQRLEEFTPETVCEMLKQSGDPWSVFYRKKANATSLAKRLDETYGFLF